MYKSEKVNFLKWWDISVEYHPTNTGIILINIPGAGGTASGYMNKYINLGKLYARKETFQTKMMLLISSQIQIRQPSKI